MKIARLLILSLIVLASPAVFAQSFPQVVAQVSLLNQTQPIRQTVLVTPTTTGLFRISVYMSAGGGPENGGNWAFTLNWVDDQGLLRHPLSSVVLQSEGSYVTTTQVIRSAKDQPIRYAVPDSGHVPEFAYDLCVTVEQLESDQ
jgi:hypothetical protein